MIFAFGILGAFAMGLAIGDAPPHLDPNKRGNILLFGGLLLLITIVFEVIT